MAVVELEKLDPERLGILTRINCVLVEEATIVSSIAEDPDHRFKLSMVAAGPGLTNLRVFNLPTHDRLKILGVEMSSAMQAAFRMNLHQDPLVVIQGSYGGEIRTNVPNLIVECCRSWGIQIPAESTPPN